MSKMFLRDNIDDVQSFFLFTEADDNDTASEDFQMSDTPDTNTNDTNTSDQQSNDDSNADNNAEEEESANDTSEENSEDFQMSDTPDTSDEGNTDDSSSNEDYSSEDGSEGETNNEDITKKYILLNSYKDLYGSTNKLIINIEKLFTNMNMSSDQSDDIEYIYNQLKTIKERLTFIIVNDFQKDSYKRLLKIYYYFDEQIKAVLNLFEKVIDQSQDD